MGRGRNSSALTPDCNRIGRFCFGSFRANVGEVGRDFSNLLIDF